MKEGYLLLATYNPNLPDPAAYLKQAMNLALSLRAPDPGEPGKVPTTKSIALLTDGRAQLSHNYRGLFDEVIVLKPDDVFPFYTKTRLYDYTPFDRTIYIDTDSLAIGDPDQLFKDLKDWAACVVNRSTGDKPKAIKMSWAADIRDIYEEYKIPKDVVFTELNSSLIFWEQKSRLAKDIFTLAEHFYASEFYTQFNGLGPANQSARGHYPDELAFETALLHTRFEPQPLDPFWMEFTRGGGGSMGWTSANKTFPLMTMPGGYGHSRSTMWQTYDRLRQHFARTLSIAEGRLGYYGQGFKMNDRNKAANRPYNSRYDGLRERKRPAAIKRLIEKYSKKK